MKKRSILLKTLLKNLMPLCHSRIKTFSEFIELFDFLFTIHLNYTEELFNLKSLSKEQITYVLFVMMLLLEKMDTLKKEDIEKASHELTELFKANYKKQIIPVLFAA